MSQKEPPQSDLELFLASVGEVKKVKSERIHHEKPKPKPIPQQSINDEKAVLVDMLSDEYLDLDIEPDETLSYKSAGLQPSAFRKLRRGEYRCEAEIDLHGYNGDQARSAFSEFLNDCKSVGIRSVIIVHGKGYSSANGPVLKARVNSWLRQRGDVIAFHSARPQDGGTGAVYVLLKSNRKIEN